MKTARTDRKVQARYSLPPSLIERVKILAARAQVTPNLVVEEILSDAIDKHPGRRPVNMKAGATA